MPQEIDIPALLRHAKKIGEEVQNWPERKRRLAYSRQNVEPSSRPEPKVEQAKKTPPSTTGD